MDDKPNTDNASPDKNLPTESLVAITAGKPVADSRVVGKAFGKEHYGSKLFHGDCCS